MAAQQNKPATGYPAPGQPSYAMGPGAYNSGYAQPYPAYQARPPGPYSRHNFMFRRILALIITLAVLAGIAILITWLVLRPHRPKFYVENATVSKLNLNADHLNSTMTFNITSRNSNKKIGIYYDAIYAKGFYDRHMIGYNQLEEFYQGHKSTKAILCSLSSNDLLLEGKASNDLTQDLARKSVDMTVRLDAWIRFKVGDWTTRHYTMIVYCDITIDWNGSSGHLARPKRCDVDI
ncbi:NDR1/HIN1-like protein 3 [Cryptomeria japonica]|uniref:NDR1/HIN1-like protein 3 n=1 Tax=Cryptomeria japonica TaxID=3369 RepID=UPI0027DA6C88|nr:NDR1/HIN1-like protein 3 [Cryptomeria japonica]